MKILDKIKYYLIAFIYNIIFNNAKENFDNFYNIFDNMFFIIYIVYFFFLIYYGHYFSL